MDYSKKNLNNRDIKMKENITKYLFTSRFSFFDLAGISLIAATLPFIFMIIGIIAWACVSTVLQEKYS